MGMPSSAKLTDPDLRKALTSVNTAEVGSLIERSHDGVLLLSRPGQFVASNRKARQILGLGSGPLFMHDLENILDRDERFAFQKFLQRLLGEGYAQGEVHVLNPRSQTRVPIPFVGHHLQVGGEPMDYLAVGVQEHTCGSDDMSPRSGKKRGEKAHPAYAGGGGGCAARESEKRQAWLSELGHKIRTPLCTFLSYADLLQQDLFDEAEKAFILQSLRVKGMELERVVDNLLSAMQAQSDELVLESRRFDLNAFLSGKREPYELRGAHRSTVIFEHEVHPGTELRGDMKRMFQVFSLLSGFAESTGSDERFHVRFGSCPRQKRDQASSSLFCGSRKGKHLGDTLKVEFLGVAGEKNFCHLKGLLEVQLAPCRELVCAMGGDLQFEEQSLGGDRIVWSLVARFPEMIVWKDMSLDSCQSTKHPAVTLAGKKVLAADDAPEIRLILKMLLSQFGAKFLIVEDGQAVVDVVSGDPVWDVVILDLNMPKRDGYSTIQNIRTKVPGALILAVTAHGTASDQRRCEEAGFDQYLQKPIRVASLVQALQNC